MKLMTFSLLINVIMEMTKRGILGGLALGAFYGAFIGAIALISLIEDDTPILNILVMTILFGVSYGVFIGSVLGLIAGTILGVFNGLIVSLITQIAFFFSINGRQYQITVGLVSVICTVVGGVIVFGFVLFAPPSPYFLEYVLIPALIATCVNGYASQRAAHWYLAAVSASI